MPQLNARAKSIKKELKTLKDDVYHPKYRRSMMTLHLHMAWRIFFFKKNTSYDRGFEN